MNFISFEFPMGGTDGIRGFSVLMHRSDGTFPKNKQKSRPNVQRIDAQLGWNCSRGPSTQKQCAPHGLLISKLPPKMGPPTHKHYAPHGILTGCRTCGLMKQI